MPTIARECAAAVLEAVPLAMRVLRQHMRSHRAPGMSVPQFRVLGYLDREGPATLSAAAEHVGTTLPSMSRMAQSLVTGRLVSREPGATDRRTIHLRITPRGRQVLERARAATVAHLAERIGRLPAGSIAQLHAAMAVMKRVGETPERCGGSGKEPRC